MDPGYTGCHRHKKKKKKKGLTELSVSFMCLREVVRDSLLMQADQDAMSSLGSVSNPQALPSGWS